MLIRIQSKFKQDVENQKVKIQNVNKRGEEGDLLYSSMNGSLENTLVESKVQQKNKKWPHRGRVKETEQKDEMHAEQQSCMLLGKKEVYNTNDRIALKERTRSNNYYETEPIEYDFCDKTEGRSIFKGSQSNKRRKITYFDRLPEANPIAKKISLGIDKPKWIYKSEMKETLLTLQNDYQNKFFLAFDNPIEFQKLIEQRELIATSNKLSRPKTSFSCTSCPNQQRFLSLFLGDNSEIVYLRNNQTSNSFNCPLEQMTEGYTKSQLNEEQIQNQSYFVCNNELKYNKTVNNTDGGSQTIDMNPIQKEQGAVKKRPISMGNKRNQVIKERHCTIGKGSLRFSSEFESGNLSAAVRKSDNEYELLLQNDVNTRGFNQWFYFCVSGTIKRQRVRMNIINMYKNDSLFQLGMKISIFSEQDYSNKRGGWSKGGENIQYGVNGYSRCNGNKYATLSFDYVFENDDDNVFFAYNVPYTYTQLNHFLSSCESNPTRSQFMSRKLLTRSLAGNRVELLSITNPSSTDISRRRGIVIAARAHPGETVSSHILEGIIEYLLCNFQFQ